MTKALQVLENYEEEGLHPKRSTLAYLAELSGDNKLVPHDVRKC